MFPTIETEIEIAVGPAVLLHVLHELCVAKGKNAAN
jgi:hypothetical protein